MRNLLIGGTLALCTALGGGCSSEDSFADGALSGDESTDGNGIGDDEGTPSDGGISSEDGGDSYESTAGDDTGSTSGGGDGEWSPCDGVDCSSIGTCISDGSDTFCECPEGYLEDGEQCVPCQPLADVTDLVLRTYEVSATWTLDWDEPPTAIYEEAQFWLENQATGDRVDFGKSWESSLGARVLPGAYDLVYSYVSGDELPQHSHYVVQSIIVRADLDFDFSLMAMPITGDIRINGELPPTVQYDDGNIVFVNPETGDSITAGSTRNGSYEVAVFPGNYELHYQVEDAGETAPANKDAKVGDTVILVDSEIHVAHVALETTTLSGEIQINGTAPPSVQYDDGNVYLRTAQGDEIHLGSTRDGAYSVVVLAGNYEFEYELEDGGIDVPANVQAQISEVNVAGPTQTFQADIPRVEYSGSFTLNGGPAPASQYDDGTVRLRNVAGGGEVYLGNTHDGTFSVGVIPGDYEVVYAVDTAGGQMPMNLDSRLGLVTISGDETTVVDVQAVTLDGAFTLAGALPPESEYEDGRLYLRSAQGDDAVFLGYTHDGSYQTVVTPGEYEVFFTHEYGSGVVPDNSNGALMSLSLSAAMSFDVDVPVVPLAGSFQVNGAEAPNSYSDAGQLYLRRRSDGDSISLGSTQAGSFEVAVTPGIYEVFYARSENVSTLPGNENARVTCFVVE